MGAGLELVAQNSYDNQWLTGWPYFRIPSVMGTGLLAHRATTAGLPIVAGAILLVVAGLPTARARLAGWRDRPLLLVLAGTLGALLAPFHFFFFPAVPLLALAWVVTGGRLVDRNAPRNAAAFLSPYLLALPFLLAPLVQAAGSGSLKLVPGWQSAPFVDGGWAVAFFYLTNLGVPFVLALVAIFVRAAPPPRLPRRVGHRPVRDPEHRAGQRRRLRHEQVLPGHVDRGRRARGLAHASMAPARGRGRHRAQRAVPAAGGGVDGDEQPPGHERRPTSRPLGGWRATRRLIPSS